MKFGVTISSLVHVGILSWSLLVANSHNKNLDVVFDNPEIDVDFTDRSTSSRGDSKAKRREKPAPKATKTAAYQKPAENVGDTKTDLKSNAELESKVKPVEVAAPPPRSVEPDIDPVPKENPKPKDASKETPVPTNVLATLNEPPEPAPDKKSNETPAKADEGQEAEKPPEPKPLPVSTPKPAELKSAKTKKRKKKDEIKRMIEQASAKEKAKKKKTKVKKKAVLVNKTKPVATGAKRNKKVASLGNEKSKGAQKLSRNEMDSLRGAIERCWNVPIGLSDAEDMRVTITMNLSKDGSIEGRVKVTAIGGENRARRAFSESARRAVLKCAPYDLPNKKYDTWSKVVVNFDPSQMF